MMDVKPFTSPLKNAPGRSNVMTDQNLKSKRKVYEDKISSYCGSDPLEPRCTLIRWLEDNCPNGGLDDGIIPLMAETLSLLKDEPKYKQDNRYVGLLIKYANLQPNPLEIFETIYKQGRGTECAILYHAWASQCMKENEYQKANELYQLGLKNKAEPIEALLEIQRLFQLNFGRRMLGMSEEAPDTPYRLALKRLHVNSQFQSPSIPKNENKEITLNADVTQSCDKENSNPVRKELGARPKTKRAVGNDVTDDNSAESYKTDKPYQRVVYPKKCDSKGKELQVEELKALDYKNNKLRRVDDKFKFRQSRKSAFHYPMAYFELDDPNKVRMYPKDKVYVVEKREFNTELNLYEIEGKEFQLEELKAIEYERRNMQNSNNGSSQLSGVKTPSLGTSQLQLSSEKMLHDSNYSVLNGQSFTVATREAMNVVRGMWTSPTPVSVLRSCGKSISKDTLSREVVKVALVPKPMFSLYVDEFNGQQPEFGQVVIDPKVSLNINRQIETGLPGNFQHQDSEELASALPTPTHSSAEGQYSAVSAEVIARQPFAIYATETDSVETCISMKHSEESVLSKVTPNKVEMISSHLLTTTTSTRKTQFIVRVHDAGLENRPVTVQSANAIGGSFLPQVEHTPEGAVLTGACHQRLPSLPYVPPPQEDVCCDEEPDKENVQPHAKYNRGLPTEKRVLSGILQPSYGIEIEPAQPVEDADDFVGNETCNTKAFALNLPSSTPFSNQSRNCEQTNDNTVMYSCYVHADQGEPKEGDQQLALSIIQEASNERYSSSSGSSCSIGQTLLGGGVGGAMKVLNTHSELKEEEIKDVEKSVSKLNLSGDIDPFCPDLLEKLLAIKDFPQKYKTGYKVVNRDAPALRENSTTTLETEKYILGKELGKGAFSRILKASHKEGNVALKIQKPAFPWEYYVASEIRNRLKNSPMLNGFLEIRRCYIFNNASVMETEWGKYGNLLTVVNAIKKSTGRPLNPAVATFFAVQIFKIVEQLHQCKIIHGDVKPDNFVLFILPTSDLSQVSVKLIDFGRSIDMTLFPENTTFTNIVKTDEIKCNEMKDGRPWSYQIDLYGLAATMYYLLMADVMKVVKRSEKWMLQKMLPRYFNKEVWKPIFEGLLNIDSCTSLPDLSQFRSNLEAHLQPMHRIASDQLITFSNIIQGQ